MKRLEIFENFYDEVRLQNIDVSNDAQTCREYVENSTKFKLLKCCVLLLKLIQKFDAFETDGLISELSFSETGECFWHDSRLNYKPKGRLERYFHYETTQVNK